MKLEQLHKHKGPEAPPLVCLTAYTAPMAACLDGVADLLLVGDSVGMVLYGEPTTENVDLETMIRHGRAVARQCQNTPVIVDMPAGSYEAAPQDALENAGKVMRETGCDGVKLEGGAAMADTVKTLVDNDIPVVGHVGLLPQSAGGKFTIQGKQDNDQERIVKDALTIEEAGAVAIVIEAVYEPVARTVTGAVNVPTIGIGASVACDGQILVSEDMLGLTGGKVPRFVKRYADLGAAVRQAAEEYRKDVRARDFPGEEHLYVRRG